jgi:hypothetical protein
MILFYEVNNIIYQIIIQARLHKRLILCDLNVFKLQNFNFIMKRINVKVKRSENSG